MNLSLRTAMRKAWSFCSTEILKLLSDLLETGSNQTRTYAHGAIYYLISERVYHDAAQAMGLADMLRYWIENNIDIKVKMQCETLIKMLDMNCKETNDIDLVSEDGDDADEKLTLVDIDNVPVSEILEETAFESVIDNLDDLDVGGVKGEELLCNKFGIYNQPVQVKHTLVSINDYPKAAIK
ncbi:hypothetical protein ROZALSC1DRAFT_31505, partial [Rozella allomycis CSF55]